MQSPWRVACVRIPRFPIGAVWRRADAERRLRTETLAQAQLTLGLPDADPRTRTGAAVPPPPPPHRAPMPDARPSHVSGADGLASRSFAPAAGAAVSSPSGAADTAPWDVLPIALATDERLRAVSAGAARRQVRAGMKVAEAKARCAALEVLAWDDTIVGDALAKATGALLLASPQVTPVAGAPGMWWVGAGGFDGIGGERGLARALLRIARHWHPEARVAIASSCVAARAAVWGDVAAMHARDAAPGLVSVIDDAAVLVPRDRCADFLARAPLALVPMDDELRQGLVALGLRTVGGLAALDAGDVEARWGAAGLAAWRLARGDDTRRPVLARVEATREVTAELAMPAQGMEPVLFLVRAALERLVGELVRDGRAAAVVSITLTLDDGRGALPSGGVARTVTREVRCPRPLARVAPLLERCRALLARWTLDAPVCAVRVTVTATAPSRGEQGSLLDTSWRDPAAMDAALERLRAELGPNVVVRPAAVDHHRPDVQRGWEEAGSWQLNAAEPGAGSSPAAGAAGAGGGRAGSQPPASTYRALRMLEAPEQAKVELLDDRPCAVWWKGRRVPVAGAEGPERLTGDWWRAPFARDYWRCEGEVEWLLFRDAAGWWVQGWYD